MDYRPITTRAEGEGNRRSLGRVWSWTRRCFLSGKRSGVATGERRERRPDRRVGRTKGRLKTALLELIDERGYERVTIDRIAQRADIGRSTFYSHYASK